MDLLALSLGKILCDASTAIVYAARCTDPSAMRPVARVQRHPARGAALERAGDWSRSLARGLRTVAAPPPLPPQILAPALPVRSAGIIPGMAA
jgi:hypothetical protein